MRPFPSKFFSLLLAICFLLIIMGQKAEAASGYNFVVTKYINHTDNNIPGITIKREIKKGKFHFSAIGKSGVDLQIFLFDMSGKLVSQAIMKMNRTISISGISKGAYFFEIFQNDYRIENGSMSIP